MNFADALDTRIDTIERPPVLPVGTYTMTVKKVPEFSEVGKGNYDAVDFLMQLIQADEDVDQDALAAYGGLSPASVTRRRFMFDKSDKARFDRTLFDMKVFLTEHLQIEGDANAPLKELLNSAVGMSCKGYIKHRPDPERPDVIYAEISKTTPV